MAGELTPSAVMAAVDDVMSRPWAWGVSDCCTAACDVFRALHGVDPMLVLRGRYHSASSAARLIADAGGFPALARDLAAVSGLRRCEPVPGAIGLSHAGAARGPSGRALLICIRPGAWAGKTMDGNAILGRAEWGWQCGASC